MSNEEAALYFELYELHPELRSELVGVMTAVDVGGGQECNIAGVLLELRNAGFEIVRTGRHAELEAALMAFAAIVKTVAFAMPAPNEYTPQLVQAALDAERIARLPSDPRTAV